MYYTLTISSIGEAHCCYYYYLLGCFRLVEASLQKTTSVEESKIEKNII